VGLEARPYVGTWRLDGQKLIQHTPDALIYLNGDTALPGCGKCSGKIDIQRFVTEVSVDAGTEPGSASASFSLSVPLHHTDSFARDAKFLLKPGLEVHVYLRGYFPVAGLYSHLAEGRLQASEGTDPITGSALAPSVDLQTVIPGETAKKPRRPDGSSYTPDDLQRAEKTSDPATIRKLRETSSMMESLHQYLEQQGFDGVDLRVTSNGGYATSGHAKNSAHHTGTAADFYAYHQVGGNRQEIDRTTVWASIRKLRAAKVLPADTGSGMYLKGGQKPGSKPVWSDVPHMDHKGKRAWIWVGGNAEKGRKKKAWEKALKPRIEGLPRPDGSVATSAQNLAGEYLGDAPPPKVTNGMEGVGDAAVRTAAARKTNEGMVAPSLLEEQGLAGIGIENTLAYPYYHVFHGVVTEVSHSYSGGVNTVSVNCSSMLHFWQFQNMSTNASVFGARPRNSKLKMSLVGHNFTGMHPYQIMYTLHHDMVGAAGGVGWALSSKSNQTAVSDVGQETLFSLNIKYWERRFSGRSIRLRMHGATGELFSTMAAAWLGRTSSASIMSVVGQRYNEVKPENATGVLGQSVAVGLMNKGKRKAIAATVQADRTRGGGADNKSKWGLNIVEMQAFVSNIGNWGQVNLFESSYESKLDVAQKVMEITGFEFYQDVDGDFVFKPPMWNMDTSGSRVYRIEDIDIIDISFSEKEPMATYMTCKGSQFKNLGGTGTENEWGVRGQYIDYRLVAQFGWRPGTYETAYFNDSKSMFFSAVNRMDVMNIGINSASVTIPERPELRPGFPVYIPYLDCFYYCNSFAHSHAVGGTCSTSLQLVGKRAKFYAPGRRATTTARTDRGALGDIDLSNTVLPERPLLVQDEDGKPRLSGFPNVVMALDPTAINPMFFVVGNDAANMSDAATIRSLLEFGVAEKVLGFPKEQPDGGGKMYTMPTFRSTGEGDEAQAVEVRFYFNEDDLKPIQASKTEEAAGVVSVNILNAAIAYEKLVQKGGKEAEKLQEKLDDLKMDIVQAQAEKAELQSGPDRNKAKTVERVASLQARILRKQKELKQQAAAANEAKRVMEAGWRTGTSGVEQGVAFLLDMWNKIGAKYRASANFQGRGDLTSTVNLLDMLSDKKAIFSNGTQPGSYRYYSASHPDAKHQAPQVVDYRTGSKTKTVTTPPAAIDGEVPEILMYAEYPKSAFPGANLPEAALVNGKPTVGIKVLNSNKEFKGGESIPTSNILELMFTVQPVTTVTSITANFRTTTTGSLGKAARSALAKAFAFNAFSIAEGSRAIKETFEPRWNELAAKAKRAIDAMIVKGKEAGVTLAASPPSFPAKVQVYKHPLPVTTVWGTLKYKGNDGTNKVSLGNEGGKATLSQVIGRVGKSLGKKFYRDLEKIRRKANADLKKGGVRGEENEAVINEFNTAFSSGLGVAVSASNRRKGTKEKKRTTTTFSPVFPVSDARGYGVIGSYRYGRAVDIEPEGVFDQLHKKDVFSLLDKHLIEQILRFFVQKKGSVRVPEMETTTVAGKKKTGPRTDTQSLKGGAAAKYINDEVVRQLRARDLTDKQILDYGFLLTSDGDQGQLQFSLANIFAEGNLDGVQKVPVINAAYSLADLNVQQSGHICDCKAAEADVEILAFGQKQFLQFSQSGTPHHEGLGSDQVDAGTRWVATAAATAAETWQQQQQALRGQVLDRGGSHIVQQVAETFGIDTGESGNAFTDALGIQGLDPAVRTSVFKKTLDDAEYNFREDGGPLQEAIEDTKRHGRNLSTSAEDDE